MFLNYNIIESVIFCKDLLSSLHCDVTVLSTGTTGILQGFRLLFLGTRKRNCLAVSGNFNSASVARIPRVRVLEDEEGSKDIELSDDPYDCIRLSVENVPCIVTLCKVWACIWWFLSSLMVSFNSDLLSLLNRLKSYSSTNCIERSSFHPNLIVWFY